MVRVTVVDAPITKSWYEKRFQQLVLLPEGEALLFEGLTLKEARRLKSAGHRFAKFLSKLEPDGLRWKLTLYRKEAGTQSSRGQEPRSEVKPIETPGQSGNKAVGQL